MSVIHKTQVNTPYINCVIPILFTNTNYKIKLQLLAQIHTTWIIKTVTKKLKTVRYIKITGQLT